MIVQFVDEQGYSVAVCETPTIIEKYRNTDGFFEVPLCSENFYKRKWDFLNNFWVEGATPEEIEEVNKPIVPDSISQMKLRKQLILSGIAISSIDALIQSLPQPNRDLIYTMWEYAVVFDRHNPELNAMAGMLGVTQQQLDDIFINGNLL
jgi:hypothetical protein